jgi:hypothetical protein
MAAVELVALLCASSVGVLPCCSFAALRFCGAFVVNRDTKGLTRPTIGRWLCCDVRKEGSFIIPTIDCSSESTGILHVLQLQPKTLLTTLVTLKTFSTPLSPYIFLCAPFRLWLVGGSVAAAVVLVLVVLSTVLVTHW